VGIKPLSDSTPNQQPSVEAGPGDKKPIQVGMFHGPGANPDILSRLLDAAGFAVRPVSVDDLTTLTTQAINVLYLPGGWYRFNEAHTQAIQAFALAGGGVVGTCAGAYVVIENLGLIPGRVLRCNMRGRLYLEPRQGDHPILQHIARRCTRHNDRTWEQLAVAHMGGPIMLLENPSHMLASYDFQGELGALATAPYGQGRAVAIASHPECSLGGFSPHDPVRSAPEPTDPVVDIVSNAVTWASGRS
jgi:hypothetical protein